VTRVRKRGVFRLGMAYAGRLGYRFGRKRSLHKLGGWCEVFSSFFRSGQQQREIWLLVGVRTPVALEHALNAGQFEIGGRQKNAFSSGGVLGLHDAPVAYSDSPFVLVAFELLAAGRQGILAARFDFAHRAGERFVRQRLELLASGSFYLNSIFSHESGRV